MRIECPLVLALAYISCDSFQISHCHETAVSNNEIRRPESYLNAALAGIDTLIAGGAGIPTSMLAGRLGFQKNSQLKCRAPYREGNVGDIISIKTRGEANDLYNLTFNTWNVRDRTSLTIIELRTLTLVPTYFHFECDRPGVFSLQFFIHASDQEGGVLGQSHNICAAEFACTMFNGDFAQDSQLSNLFQQESNANPTISIQSIKMPRVVLGTDSNGSPALIPTSFFGFN